MSDTIINHCIASHLTLHPDVHTGCGVFETIRVRRMGTIASLPLLDSHIQRIDEGNIIARNPSFTTTTLKDDLHKALTTYPWKTDEENALLRIILYSTQLFISVSPWEPRPECSSGINAATFEAERFLPQYKSTSALVSVTARNYATWRNAHEALLVNRRDEVTEGAWSNFFWVCAQGILHTAKEEEVLPGVTRAAVLHSLGRDIQKIEEASLLSRVMNEAVECFITQSTHGIVPLLTIDGKIVGDGMPGDITSRIRAEYEEFVKLNSAHFSI